MSRGQPGRRLEAPSRSAVELKLGPEFVPEVGFKHEPKRGAWSQPESASGRGLGADPAADTDADSDSDTLSLAPQTTPYTSALDDEMREDGVTASIERALETDGFTVMYQPIISLMGDSQEHYSVLVRLRGEHDRLLTAHELLGPAARAGSLPDVDRWVMQRAFQEQARRRRLGQKVSLFLSLSKEIVQDERLLISICDSLREFEIRGSWVTFQFQQSEALALGDKWTLLADGLKRIQCRICVNQVGLTDDTEQAMDTMQADFVKFAPELAIGLATEQAIQKRLLQLINSAQERGVKTIVTGVEDARSLALLWSTGIAYVQGNFLQRALPNLDAPT
jgi:EAL domain-containing protein (putative c-di-GMP-specific phosphodiesterase class I)